MKNSELIINLSSNYFVFFYALHEHVKNEYRYLVFLFVW